MAEGEPPFWDGKGKAFFATRVKNLEPQFHLKSHEASSRVVCRTWIMR